ncbi:hypothetical protein DPM19_09245 [Actinomadura craniellae]|uniref:Effector-associated domain-containing protein n=1 Tax=Actinomadura craniellae TaxID=2231787 RepID=A0A365HAG8_9ACTN|nr:hypothetical protein [Actinomadura craniellae]RAY15926.1 hypothetical protein DPM19_09245 [Actinomadura craniellae]
MISPLAEQLDAELRRQHEVASPVARIRLRAALHIGEVHSDDHGIAGAAVNHAFRLLEAPSFKQISGDSRARLALIVSQLLHDDVVRHAVGLVNPANYRQIIVENKETRTTGWIRLLGTPGEDRTPDPPADHPIPPEKLMNAVERLLELPIMKSGQGRDLVVGALGDDIARSVPRQPEDRLDVYCILDTCLDRPGALRKLLDVLDRWEHGSPALREAERVITLTLGQSPV